MINADDRLVKDHFTVVGIDRDLFDNRPVTGNTNGVEVPQTGTRQVQVSNRDEIKKARFVMIIIVIDLCGEVA